MEMEMGEQNKVHEMKYYLLIENCTELKHLQPTFTQKKKGIRTYIYQGKIR